MMIVVSDGPVRAGGSMCGSGPRTSERSSKSAIPESTAVLACAVTDRSSGGLRVAHFVVHGLGVIPREVTPALLGHDRRFEVGAGDRLDVVEAVEQQDGDEFDLVTQVPPEQVAATIALLATDAGQELGL